MAEITRARRALYRVARHCSEHGWGLTLSGHCRRCERGTQFALWGGYKYHVQIGSREDDAIQRFRRMLRGMRAFNRAMERFGEALGLTPAPGESRPSFADRVLLAWRRP